MADEKNTEKKPKTAKPKKKANGKIDTPTIIFFSILVIGLIIFTVILLTRPTSKIYSAQYGDTFTIAAELYSNGNIDLAVDVGEDRVIQSGTFEEITDDDIEDNYSAIFVNEEDKTNVEVELLIVDDELTITYDDGTEIILKENK